MHSLSDMELYLDSRGCSCGRWQKRQVREEIPRKPDSAGPSIRARIKCSCGPYLLSMILVT